MGRGTTTLSYHGETGQVADEVGSDGSRLHRELDGFGRESGYYLWDGSRLRNGVRFRATRGLDQGSV